MKAFHEKSQYSWRKIVTACTMLVFMYSAVGFLHGLPELPASTDGVIYMVFAFYFFKNTKLPFGNKPEKNDT